MEQIQNGESSLLRSNDSGISTLTLNRPDYNFLSIKLLKELENNLYVVLTKRSKNLSSHPGQISFPGGKVDKNDNSLLHAGLREVEEEIGIKQESIENFGFLTPHETISRFIIYPFVGFIREKFQQSETARLYDEKRWLKAYRNYRGLYGPEMAFRDNEKSKVFVIK